MEYNYQQRFRFLSSPFNIEIANKFCSEHPNDKVLFEVKNTDNKNYIRDSIYKVMGYLNDFEGDENEKYLTEKYPIILVTFDGITQEDIDYENEKIVICNNDEFKKYLEEGIFLKNCE